MWFDDWFLFIFDTDVDDFLFYVDIKITAVVDVYCWHDGWLFTSQAHFEQVLQVRGQKTSIKAGSREHTRDQPGHLATYLHNGKEQLCFFRNSWEDLGSSEQSLELDILGGRRRRRRRKDGANWQRGKHRLIFFSGNGKTRGLSRLSEEDFRLTTYFCIRQPSDRYQRLTF